MGRLMALPAFKKFNTPNRELNQVQQNVEAVLVPVLGASIVDGQLLEDVALSAGANTVNHKLGRKYTGYIVTSKNANQAIWDAGSSDPATSIIIHSAGSVTVDLWVF